MIGRPPHEIWQDSLEDGQRRLAQPTSVIAATALLGGLHVTLGLLALLVTTGALVAVLPSSAHVLASLTFGFGLVFITLGRSELSHAAAAGKLGDTLTQRDLLAAVLSAVLAGAIITLFTWITEAAESDLTRLFAALLIGFVLLAPSTNHSVVGFGEVLLVILSGTSSADWMGPAAQHSGRRRGANLGRWSGSRGLRPGSPGAGAARRQA